MGLAGDAVNAGIGLTTTYRILRAASGHMVIVSGAGVVRVESGRDPYAAAARGLRWQGAALGRAFQPTGLQVLFALLCNPERINRPYRKLAVLADVAHGTVGWVIPDLQQQGFVADLKGKRGTRRMFQLERLLAQWVDAYARQLRPRLLIGRYYVPTLTG